MHLTACMSNTCNIWEIQYIYNTIKCRAVVYTLPDKGVMLSVNIDTITLSIRYIAAEHNFPSRNPWPFIRFLLAKEGTVSGLQKINPAKHHSGQAVFIVYLFVRSVERFYRMFKTAFKKLLLWHRYPHQTCLVCLLVTLWTMPPPPAPMTNEVRRLRADGSIH